MVAGEVGEEHRQPRQRLHERDRDHQGLLQFAHRVPHERDRHHHHDHERDRERGLHRDASLLTEDRPPDPEQDEQAEERAERHVALEPFRVAEQRLVEQRGLQTLAIHGGEPDRRERHRGAGRRRGPDLRLEELHPPALVQPREHPERHVEQDDDGEDRDRRLEDLAGEGREVEEQRDDRERHDRQHDRADHPERERFAVADRAARLEVAEDRRHHEHRLQPFAEQDEERVARGDRRRRDAGGRQHTLDVVQPAPHRRDLGRDLIDGSPVLDHRPKRGELLLDLEGQPFVEDPQRDLGVLEVIEVGVARQLVRGLGVTGPVRRERVLQQRARLVHLLDTLVGAHVARDGRRLARSGSVLGERRTGERRRHEHEPQQEQAAASGPMHVVLR